MGIEQVGNKQFKPPQLIFCTMKSKTWTKTLYDSDNINNSLLKKILLVSDKPLDNYDTKIVVLVFDKIFFPIRAKPY